MYFGVLTSKSSKRYMVYVIEAINWFGIERGVKISEASCIHIQEELWLGRVIHLNLLILTELIL
ncbi:recombination protein NinB [Enterobacter ludwigii]|uniref:recombination protein NinB n=1 Tax=Enterobacter ludwigii TaxID=299767 RepID=UPI003F72A477